jgi:two-component system NtrC family sensor kinase
MQSGHPVPPTPPAGRRQLRRVNFAPLWAAAVLLPLLSLAGGAWWSWRLVQAEARLRVERTALTLREHAQRAFETQDALLAAVQRLTQGMSWDEIAGSGEVAAFLRDLDAATPGAGAIGMIDPRGRLAHISTQEFPTPRTDFSDRDYVRAQQDPATAGPFVGQRIVARLNALLVFPYSRPRLGLDGRPDGGTLWATFRTTDLAGFYARLLEHPRDSVAMVRADGALLTRHPPPPGGPEVARPPAGSAQLAAIAEVAGKPAGERALFFRATSMLDGEPRLHALLRVGDLPVVVGYALHPAGPRAAWLGQVTAMAAVAGLACLLLLTLTWMFASRARSEVEALEEAHAAAEARADAEARLREGERLGALGLVAAGVAHDFRNLIQAVQGGVQMIRAAARGGDTARVFLVAGMVEETAARGAALTDRMLRAARPEAGEDAGTETLDPLAMVERLRALLAGMLGAAWRPRLVVAGEVVAPEGSAHLAGLPPGAYARFAVTDAGMGMDAATLARAGEAFFTTKPQGAGTGLGLVAVRAFAREAGGGLLVESPGPGLGATVTLWLPAA